MKLMIIFFALALPSCSVVKGIPEDWRERAGVDPDAPAKFMVGKRWVVGVVFFDAIGLGIFLPAKEIAEMNVETGK
jgi:hypothetical protein